MRQNLKIHSDVEVEAIWILQLSSVDTFGNLRTAPHLNPQRMGPGGTFQTQTMTLSLFSSQVHSELLTPQGNPDKEGPRAADILQSVILGAHCGRCFQEGDRLQETESAGYSLR